MAEMRREPAPIMLARYETALRPVVRQQIRTPHFRDVRPIVPRDLVVMWMGKVPAAITDRGQRRLAAAQAAKAYQMALQFEDGSWGSPDYAARRVLEAIEEQVGAQASMGDDESAPRMFYGQIDEWSPEPDRDSLD